MITIKKRKTKKKPHISKRGRKKQGMNFKATKALRGENR